MSANIYDIASKFEGMLKNAGNLTYRNLLDIIANFADLNFGLVFVPDIVDKLSDYNISVIHSALLFLAENGHIELRPESGLNRLSQEERDKCLVGPSGKLVSYIAIRYIAQ
jgi:hypothetical protein